MEDLTVGFIGGGAMAEALTAGITGQQVVKPDNIYISDHKQSRCEALRNQYGVNAMVGAESFAAEMDVLVLAIKPQVAQAAMDEVKGLVRPGTIVVSIVAGLTLSVLEQNFPGQPVVRVMPNTPLAVGAGMSAYACGKRTTKGDASVVQELLSAAGEAVQVQEAAMDAVTGLSGSGPAYGFLMIDALSDGGVAAGLKRDVATKLAAQTLLGAAKMVLATGKHPDVLRDQVTSPAGTTIAGVRVLEQQGLRGALIDAVLAATEKSRELGKK